MSFSSFKKCQYLYPLCKVPFRLFAARNAGSSSKSGAPVLLWAMPVVSFGLGTWQVHRLQWKKSLIQQLEDRTMREPLEIEDRLVDELVRDGQLIEVTARNIQLVLPQT